MISKIHNIRGVGRFKDFECKDGIDLDKLTLIFSENGQGKSTLADILRSLSDGDDRRLLGRKTVGATDQFIKFEYEDGVRCFHNGSWNKELSNILVFDEVFINDNIYEGLSIRPEQREKLHPIIVGEVLIRGVQKEESLVASRKNLRDARKKTEQLMESAIREAVNNQEFRLTVEAFLGLERLEDIGSRIADQQARGNKLENSQQIHSESKLKTIDELALPIGKLRNLLNKKLQNIADDAELTLQTHVDQFSGNEMKPWLNRGTQYIRESDEICPYCGLPLEDSHLIVHYKAIFEDTYEKFETEVSEFSSRHLDFTRRLADVRSNHQFNLGRTFWAAHIPNLEIPTIDVDLVEQALTQAKHEMKVLLTEKSTTLFKAVEESPELAVALSRWTEVWQSVEEYNENICAINEQIENLRSEAKSENLAKAKRELARLKQVELRYRDDIDSACKSRNRISKELEDLDEELDNQRKTNIAETERTFAKYGSSLDTYLRAFGANFQVKDLVETRVGGVLRAQYEIGLLGETIPLGNQQTDISQRSFRNVLSEGDKRTLALAFFLSKLDLLDDISKIIVVFDDPVTSLDENRQLYTSEIVGDLSATAEQVIVLSHRPEFLYKVWDHFGNGAKYAVPCELLEVRHTEDELDFSEIRADWDIRAAVRSFYAGNIRRVLDFMQGSHQYEPNYIAMILRPILETHFKTCYPDEFSGDSNLGRFIGCISCADANSPLYALQGDVADELDKLNRYLTPSQHGGDLPPNVKRNWILPYCRRVLAVVGRI